MVETRIARTPDGVGSLDSQFDRAVERATKAVTELDPVRASWLGIRGRHDHLLADCSPEGMEHARSVLTDLLGAFDALDPDRLSPVQRIDRELARGMLSTLVSVATTRPAWRTRPQTVVSEVLSGVSVHMVRGCGTPDERGAALLGRLRSVPSFLAQARRSLQEPPPIFTEVAIVATESTRRSLTIALGDFTSAVTGPALIRSLERAGKDAIEALAGYGDFLRSDLMSRSTGDFRIGAPMFNRILREEHRLPMDGEELVALGERLYHRTLREVRSLAGSVRPGANWSRLLSDLEDEHPPAEELIDAYRAAVEKSRRFLVEHELVTLPEDDEIVYLQTPLFARRRFPHAAYLPCGASETRVRGLLLVSAPDESDPPARARSLLRGHSVHAIPVRALRETYPGRHLQFVHAARCGRPLRMIFPSVLFTQGWSLYCEDMMRQAGFLTDDRARFLQSRERLRCACRIVVDVGLHLGRMTVNEAVAFLVRKAKLERPDAVKEVSRCCEEPTLMMSCLLGKLLLEELREDDREHRGADFSWGSFHDRVLAQGALPPDLLRVALDVPRRRSDRDMFLSLSRSPRAPRRRTLPEPMCR